MEVFHEYLLPIKPISYNTYYRIFCNRYIISKHGQQFRNDIKEAFKKYNTVCHNKPIKMIINFEFTDKRKHDLDNVLKSIIDACKGILYTDDCLIYSLECTKKLSQKYPSINIHIEQIII